MRWVILAVLQAGTLWGVITLWKANGPIVGFPGLALWLAGCYWLADRLDREADQHFLEELRRRGWRPPSP
jgi:hypothetical protein